MYKQQHFPAEIIQYAVWLYFRFNLSHRDIDISQTRCIVNETRLAIVPAL
jgi:transposase-like protein